MRGTVISKGSKFRYKLCQKCSQPVRVGQGAVTHTLFLTSEPILSSQTGDDVYYRTYEGRPQDSMHARGIVRIVWHSGCLKSIVDKAPLEDQVVERMVADHRQKIVKRLRSS